jgi:hypothetical protein
LVLDLFVVFTAGSRFASGASSKWFSYKFPVFKLLTLVLPVPASQDK